MTRSLPTSPDVAADLIARLLAAKSGSNELDVLMEVALFEPDEEYVACRANNAGTKVIYTRADGGEQTNLAPDRDPSDVAAILTSRRKASPQGGEG